jgi:hypothetical protein
MPLAIAASRSPLNLRLFWIRVVFIPALGAVAQDRLVKRSILKLPWKRLVSLQTSIKRLSQRLFVIISAFLLRSRAGKTAIKFTLV